MGNAESKAEAKLEVILPHACGNYFRRRELIKNTILLLKTDTYFSRLLGFDTSEQVPDIRPKTWSFEYLIAATRGTNTSNTDMSVAAAEPKQNHTVTIALLVDNVFRWKVDALVTNQDRDGPAFHAKATEALGDVVDALLAERLQGVYQFVRSGEQCGASVVSTQIATPLSSAPQSPEMADALPSYEDVKR